jgi:hypothetical protein
VGETSVQIERHIQETRRDLSENVRELEDKVTTAVDWRAQAAKRPVTMIALAFGAGALLSALLRSPRSSRTRPTGGRPTAPPDRDAARRLPIEPGSEGRGTTASEIVDSLKHALICAATARLSGFIKDLASSSSRDHPEIHQAPSRQPV